MFRPLLLFLGLLLLGNSTAFSPYQFGSDDVEDVPENVPLAWRKEAEDDGGLERDLPDQESLDSLSEEELAQLNQTLTTFKADNCGQKNGNPSGFIVGGTEASSNAWPWAIGLIRYGSFICGGSIISERYILTAAHCVSRNRITQAASSFQVLVGAHTLGSSGQLFPVERVTAHESYNEIFMQNDIALLKLKSPINFASFGNRARPVCLPTTSMDSKNFEGRPSTIVGWGTTSEGGSIARTLRQVSVPIISNRQCANNYNSMNIRSGQICAAYPQGGRDSCQGDSGGSLTVNEGGKYYQLGVVSWGQGCARPGKPGVYTRVSKQLAWIARKTK